jgi:hypothetical protein
MSKFETPLPPYNASDPTATFLNTSCLELLMIELVPMAFRVVRDVEASPAEEEERDAVFFRLDALGYRVGQGLVERYVFSVPRLRPYHGMEAHSSEGLMGLRGEQAS